MNISEKLIFNKLCTTNYALNLAINFLKQYLTLNIHFDPIYF